jgi:membrane protease YdiL (CAAX protease family)
MRQWDSFDIILFELVICCLSWLLLALGLIAPPKFFVLYAPNFSIGIPTILIVAASIFPGIILLVCFKELRGWLLGSRAHSRVYILASFLGLVLPFSAHLGCTDSGPLWEQTTLWTITRVLLINISLSPLWEEVVWRGFFYQKIIPIMSRPSAMLTATLGWTVWHVGFLSILFKNGLPWRVLWFLPVQYFCIGIILCAVFRLASNSVLPCVLLHAIFNASTSAYFGGYSRVTNSGCYLAETVTIFIASLLLFVIANRKTVEGSSSSTVVEVR